MNYRTPEAFDNILLTSDGEKLTGLFFEESEETEKILDLNEKSLRIFEETSLWLDIYFSGKCPDFTPAFRIDTFSEFRKRVFDIMQEIPYGKTVTYKYIAERISVERSAAGYQYNSSGKASGLSLKTSARAVGGAVGANPISIIIPCHRVVGSDGGMTGYGGGLKNKIALLKLEKALSR